MPIRVYTLYATGAAAVAVANVQMLAPGEILGLNFAGSAAVGNGAIAEISTSAARQYGANNTQGILGTAGVSPSAAGAPLAANHFAPLPPGCKVGRGDFLYMHTTQTGAGGASTWTVQVYVRES